LENNDDRKYNAIGLAVVEELNSRLDKVMKGLGGIWQRSWLRHYAASWKVECLIPDEIIGFVN
jgi:hypothetical protein